MRNPLHAWPLNRLLSRAPQPLPCLECEREGAFVTVNGQRFFHDRSELLPIIERVPQRGIMVEVGSLAGFSTRLFARHFEHVYSVDPYEAGYDAQDPNSAAARLALAREMFTLRFIDEPNVTQFREPSAEACSRFPDGTLDFIYIDAGHNYPAVTADIRCWLPKLRDGGVMAGDDYGWDGVAQAVREVLPEHDVVSGRWVARAVRKTSSYFAAA